MTGSKNILIIDDHSLFADGLALILKAQNEELNIDISNDAASVLPERARLMTYDLILIDLHMPTMSGFAFLSAVNMQKLAVRVGVISGTEHKADIERAISLGACGFIPKDSPSAELTRAAKILLSGKSYLPDKWVGEIDWLPGKNIVDGEGGLTERQIQVLSLIRDGLQNKQIASVIGISVSGVKGHVENIFKALNVNNRTACVQAARDAGLI